MKYTIASAFLSFTLVAPAHAALPVGTTAPSFTVDAVLNGAITQIALADLLREGPVVLYFFPSAFTEAAETREFAAVITEIRAADATVIGMSRDSVGSLTGISTAAAGVKFGLGSADEALANAFDVNDGAMFSTRTTYVIAPSGKVAFVYNSDDERGHAQRALAFVQQMKK